MLVVLHQLSYRKPLHRFAALLNWCDLVAVLMSTHRDASDALFDYAPPSVTIKSVSKPTQSPTKIPIMRTRFVVSLLPVLYMSIET